MSKSKLKLVRPQGKSLSLFYTSEEDYLTPLKAVKAVEELLNGLYPILQPLSADLWLSYFAKETGIPLRSYPSISMWHSHEIRPPLDTTVEPGMGGVQDIQITASLKPSFITSWLSQALQQASPDSEKFVSFTQLSFYYTRIRLIADERWSNLTKIAFWHGLEPNEQLIAEIPIEIHQDGLWVAGRTKDVLNPPVELILHNKGDMLEGHLVIHWSLWENFNYLEGHNLDKVLKELSRTTSWQLG